MPELEITASAKELAEDLELNIEEIPAADGKKITKADVEAYVDALPENNEEAEVETPDEDTDAETETEEEAEVDVKNALICVFDIKDGSKTYKAGKVYKGSDAKRLLKEGALKKA